MISNHFFSRYGLALVMQQNSLTSIENISPKMLTTLIEEGMNHFRLQPNKEDNEIIEFRFAKHSFLSENPKYISKHCNEGFFLSPNALTKDVAATNNWKAMLKIKDLLEKKTDFNKSEKATMSIIPLTSKFNNGRMTQSPPTSSFFETCLCMITTSTPDKPSLHLIETQSNGVKSYIPTAIIPDLELSDLIKFITIFKEMKRTQTKKLMIGSIKRENKKVIYIRPRISFGNFPYAPSKRRELAGAALLGAIGWWAKQAEYPNTNAEEVLEKLKQRPMYIVSYGKAQSVTYNHYVVELAKSNELNTIIDALERISVYASDEKSWKNVQQKRDTFFLFASRFLQLFDKQSFSQFISIRGEYPEELILLIKTYYRRVMKIEQNLIESAFALGQWLNRISFFSACSELNIDPKNKGQVKANYKELSKQKAKVLVELESAAFSAKTSTALVSQVITRAGRISGQDAPNDSQSFIQAVIAGKLGETEKESLENSKNMIVVFSRIRSSREEPTIELVEQEKDEIEEIQLSEEEQE
ncbi:MAG: hypothetical protein AB1695_11055 [Stygiobacter sp.]